MAAICSYVFIISKDREYLFQQLNQLHMFHKSKHGPYIKYIAEVSLLSAPGQQKQKTVSSNPTAARYPGCKPWFPMVYPLFCIVKEVQKRNTDEKGKVKSNSVLAMLLSIESKQGTDVQHGVVLQCGHLTTPAGLLPICFTKDCRMTAAFFSTIPSQSQTSEVQME